MSLLQKKLPSIFTFSAPWPDICFRIAFLLACSAILHCSCLFMGSTASNICRQGTFSLLIRLQKMGLMASSGALYTPKRQYCPSAALASFWNLTTQLWQQTTEQSSLCFKKNMTHDFWAKQTPKPKSNCISNATLPPFLLLDSTANS